MRAATKLATMDLRCAGAAAVALEHCSDVVPSTLAKSRGCEWSDWFRGDAAGETPVSLPVVYDGVHGTKGFGPVCSTWVTIWK